MMPVTVQCNTLTVKGVHEVVSHFAELTDVSFNENVYPMSSCFLEFCHSFDQLVTKGLPLIQFCL